MSQNPIDASDILLNLIFQTLSIAAVSIQDGKSLSPFVISDRDGKRVFHHFASFETSPSAEDAREFLANLSEQTTRYALAYDAYWTFEDQKYDAVMVEAGERGKDFGLLFAQRYRPKTDTQSFERIGNIAYLGKEEQRLK